METVGSDQTIQIKKDPLHKTHSSRIYNGRFDDKAVIVKRINVDSHKSELNYLRELENTNVVKYLYHDEDDDFLYIVLEKCDMTLTEYVENKKDSLNHCGLMWQIVKGMVYIHKIKNIIHRDLKPSNILLVSRDGEWTVKISDFGISKELPPGQSNITQSISGSVGYMAPECMDGKKATTGSDIFSLGLIFTFVVSEGQHPFGMDPQQAHENISNKGAIPNLDCLKSEYKHDADSLIRRMISWDPKDRPDIKEVQAHHLFWNADKKLLFMHRVSNFLIKDDNLYPEMQRTFDDKQAEVAPNWRTAISDRSVLVGKVVQEMKNKRQKDGICDLLRNIRNLLNHYDEKVSKYEDFEKEIGQMPDGFYSFFKELFPQLWDHVYTTMKKCSVEFKDFYEYDDSQHLVLEASSETDETCAETSYGDQGGDINPLRNQNDSQLESICNIQDLSLVTDEDFEAVSSHEKIKRDHETSMPIQIGPVKIPEKKEVTKELVLRNYQWELAKQALKGKNSLIVAPTGSGKTVVLTQIIKEHFIKNPNGRVMFLVPKTALARQQCSFLRKHLPQRLRIEFMIGEAPGNVPVGQRLLHSQVTVLTHQVLVNELQRIESDRYLSFSDISLLILDECHSTHGNHPYRVLMNLLLDSNDDKPGHITTQVIGVTASPGVGRAKYKDQVYKNLIRLLANLNVKSAPVTVVENMEDLNKHNNEIKESLLQIETEVEFSKNIQSAILTIEKVITEKILKQMESVRAPPNNKSSIAYDNWVHDVILHAKHHIRNGETARKLIALAEHLAMYHSLLQLKDLMPDALKAVSSMVVLEGEAQEKTWLRTLYERLSEKAINVWTPMIDCLVNIIFEEFQRNPDARCMVFVKRRQTAAYLCDYLANTDKLKNLKPLYMLGRNARPGEDYCGTDHVVVRKEFEDGTSKLLICTSVAEEGLDFVACSLVIMYNYVTGEIGRIQRSGRARAAKSRAIIITSKNSSHAKQEEDNRLCAIATSVAIEDVKKKEEAFPEQLLQEIQDEQERQKVERRNAEAVSQEMGGNEEPEKWKVFCAHCKNFLTTGDKLRNLDVHTVIHDEEFYNRTTRDFVEKEKGMHWGDVDYLCNNDVCSIKVAWGMVRNGIRYPTLTIRKILLGHDESGRFVSPGQRKKMPFKILKNVDGNDSSAYERSDKRGPVNDPKPPDEESCIEMLDMIDAWGDD